VRFFKDETASRLEPPRCAARNPTPESERFILGFCRHGDSLDGRRRRHSCCPPPIGLGGLTPSSARLVTDRGSGESMTLWNWPVSAIRQGAEAERIELEVFKRKGRRLCASSRLRIFTVSWVSTNGCGKLRPNTVRIC
jgi:hypothetical protein